MTDKNSPDPRLKAVDDSKAALSLGQLGKSTEAVQGRSSKTGDSEQYEADYADNLVDEIQNLFAAHLWFVKAGDDTVQWFHAEEHLLYVKKKLAQRLRNAVGQDKLSKNAPQTTPEKQREATDGK